MKINKIKFLSTISDLRSDKFSQLLLDGKAILVGEKDAYAELKKLTPHELVVLITNSSELISLAKNLQYVIPVQVNLSVSELSIGIGCDSVLSPDNESINNLFDNDFQILLSLWGVDFQSTKIKLENYKKELLKKIFVQNGVYIFGTGTIGKQVLQECQASSINVLGFVDNDANKIGTNVFGIEVKGLKQLNSHDSVVVIATGKSAEEIRHQLSAGDFKNIINLSQFFYSVDSTNEPEVNYLDDLIANKFEWLKFGLGLKDNKSLRALGAILRHRLSLDTQYLAAIHDKKVIQWFDEQFIKKTPEAVFVDCGAYDGDTAEAFFKFNGIAKKIHAFEIDLDIAERAKKRLRNIECAEVHACGVADIKKKLSFSKTGITHGRLGSEGKGSIEVDVVTIDAEIPEKITYLKLDVEGAEEMAINGAKDQIKNNNPALGIAVYHKAEDIWKIAKQISEINPKYQFHLRHYTDVSFETVIYGLARV